MDDAQSILIFLAQEKSLGFGEMVPAIGIVLVTMGLLMSYRKRRRRRHYEPTLTPDERVGRNRQAKGMQADLEDLMVEIQDLARRFSAQLEAKTITMETKLSEADARIEQLERLLAQVDARLQGDCVVPEGDRPMPQVAETPASFGTTDQQSDHDPSLGSNIIAPPASDTDSSDMDSPDVMSRSEQDGAQDQAGDPLAAEVYRLADDGLDVADISQKLSEHVGKVELILALRPGS